jgi:hypothetical protein
MPVLKAQAPVRFGHTMSYIRGDYYLWADDESVHVWARDGYDGWDDSVWNEGHRDAATGAEAHPSGVAVPLEIADEFAVMRVAQLIEAHQLADIVSRTIEKWQGNGGCQALTAFGEQLKRLDR